MADVTGLLGQFIAEDRAGATPSPREYLEQLSGTDRDELEALIDHYLAEAPRRRFDEAAFAHSPARTLSDELARSLSGAGGTWPALLPRLRHRARLRRAELITQLAAGLGVAGRESKVGAYYHRMEQGTLPESGIDDRVLEVLGQLVGATAESLRAAGRATTGTASSPSDVAFARIAAPDPAFEYGLPPLAGPRTADRDEVDELFSTRQPL